MRTLWKLLIAFACIVASASCLLSAVLWSQVQASRKDSVRINCQQQNVRHDTTLRRLNALVAEIPLGSPRRARAEKGKAGTEALIESLAPKFDCDKRADQLVK